MNKNTISNDMKTFLKQNIQLLNSKNMDALYDACGLSYRPELTEILTSVGVDPVQHFKDTIPACYAKTLQIEEVFIPDNIKNIEYDAFKVCDLKRVRFPRKMDMIDSHAFSYTMVNYLVLPEKLDCLDQAAFSSIDELKEIVLPKHIGKYISFDIFHHTPKTLDVVFPGTMNEFKEAYVDTSIWNRLSLDQKEIICTDGVYHLFANT